MDYMNPEVGEFEYIEPDREDSRECGLYSRAPTVEFNDRRRPPTITLTQVNEEEVIRREQEAKEESEYDREFTKITKPFYRKRKTVKIKSVPVFSKESIKRRNKKLYTRKHLFPGDITTRSKLTTPRPHARKQTTRERHALKNEKEMSDRCETRAAAAGTSSAAGGKAKTKKVKKVKTVKRVKRVKKLKEIPEEVEEEEAPTVAEEDEVDTESDSSLSESEDEGDLSSMRARGAPRTKEASDTAPVRRVAPPLRTVRVGPGSDESAEEKTRRQRREDAMLEDQQIGRQIRIARSNMQAADHEQKKELRTLLMVTWKLCVDAKSSLSGDQKEKILGHLLSPNGTCMISQLFGAFPGPPPPPRQDSQLFLH